MSTDVDRLAPHQTWAVALGRWTTDHSVWNYTLDVARNVLNATATTLVVQPLARLYLEGPRVIGFWGGLSPNDICAQLTNTHADFWALSEANRDECMDTIRRHFWSWLVLGTTVSYFVIVFGTLCTCWRRRFGRGRAPPQIVIMHDRPPGVPPT